MAASGKALNFSSVEDLKKILSLHQVDPSRWKGIKVETLFNDLQNGECVLELKDSKLYRKIFIVSVYCFFTNRKGERFRLKEEKQILPNGEERMRGYDFVSETLKRGETPLQTAERALAEELQISDPILIFQRAPELDEDKIKESPTYVGIMSHYIVYYFKTEIPSRHFKPDLRPINDSSDARLFWRLKRGNFRLLYSSMSKIAPF